MKTDSENTSGAGLKTIALIGCAWFGMNMFFSFNMASMPLFFKARIEQKWVVGLILGMMGAFGMILSPFLGMFSDRLRHKLGRRRPMMIVALPFMVAALVFAQHMPWVWLIALAWMLAYLFHPIIERPWNALIPDFFPPEKRASVNGVVQLLGGIGSLTFFLLGSYIWARNEELTFYLVATMYAAGVLAIIFGIKERPTHLDPPKVAERVSFGEYISGLREHKNLMRIIFASLFWNIGLNGVAPWLTSFGTEEMGMSVELSFMPLALLIGVMILFAVPVGLLADRFGRKRLTSVGLAGDLRGRQHRHRLRANDPTRVSSHGDSRIWFLHTPRGTVRHYCKPDPVLKDGRAHRRRSDSHLCIRSCCAICGGIADRLVRELPADIRDGRGVSWDRSYLAAGSKREERSSRRMSLRKNLTGRNKKNIATRSMPIIQPCLSPLLLPIKEERVAMSCSIFCPYRTYGL